MNLPTDTELEKRANDLSVQAEYSKALPFRTPYSLQERFAYRMATLEALKIDRESYRLLRHARHDAVTAFAYWKEHGYKEMADESKERVDQIDAHLTTLRTRLGITE